MFPGVCIGECVYKEENVLETFGMINFVLNGDYICNFCELRSDIYFFLALER